MKKCSDCNIEMIEDTNLHTDYVGGASFEEQIFLTTYDKSESGTSFLGIEFPKTQTKRVKARVCPKCGKVEFFISLEEK